MQTANRGIICNIGPHEFRFSRSYGQYLIQGAKPGEPYALTVISDAKDRIDMGDAQKLDWPVAAPEIAKDLVEAEGLAVFGCFVIAGERPTKAELETAEKIRHAYRRKKIAEADGLWAKYHRLELIDDNSKEAALALGEEREWAYQVSSKIDCPGCGEKIPAGIARHSCGYIVDVDRAQAGGLIDETEARRLRQLRVKQAKAKPAPVAAGGMAEGDDDDYVDPAEQVLKDAAGK